jgi:hypothetical protein
MPILNNKWSIKNPMSIDFVRPERNKIDPNENVEVVVHVVLDKPHHAYSERFRVLAPDLDWLQVGGPRIKDEVDFFDPISKKNKKGLGAGPGEIAFVIEPKAEAPTGQRSLKFELEYQACTEKYCLLPIRLPFELEISIGSEAAVSGQPKETLLGLNRLTSKEGIQGLLGQNLALAFLLVFFRWHSRKFHALHLSDDPDHASSLRCTRREKNQDGQPDTEFVLCSWYCRHLLSTWSFCRINGFTFWWLPRSPCSRRGLGLDVCGLRFEHVRFV